MELTSCPHCGVVYDLVSLRTGDMNHVYDTGHGIYMQCRMCFKRNKISESPEVCTTAPVSWSFHDNCVQCDKLKDGYYGGFLSADDLVKLMERHIESRITPLEERTPSPYTLDEIKKLSGTFVKKPSCEE